MMVAPLVNPSDTAGIVIVGSTPAIAGGTSGFADVARLAMITAIAPAFWAFFALTAKPQVPRLRKAMLPATAAALVIGEQPSTVDGPAASAASSARTTPPVRPVLVTGAPNCARPAE